MLSTRATGAALRAAQVCPEAPTGVQGYADDFTSWTLWAVLVILAIAAVAGAGMLVFGRLTGHPKGARLGLEVIMAVIGGAVLFVILPGIVSGITGKGCV